MGEIQKETCISNYNIVKVVSRFYSLSSLPKYLYERRIHVCGERKKHNPRVTSYDLGFILIIIQSEIKLIRGLFVIFLIQIIVVQGVRGWLLFSFYLIRCFESFFFFLASCIISLFIISFSDICLFLWLFSTQFRT